MFGFNEKSLIKTEVNRHSVGFLEIYPQHSYIYRGEIRYFDVEMDSGIHGNVSQ